jgi:hypothetical protein
MTYDEPRTDRVPTDEPDGTSAYAASLRPPGESVGTPSADSDTAEEDADFFAGTGRETGDPAADLDDDLVDEFGADVGDQFSPDDVDPTTEAARRVHRPADSRAGYDVEAVSGDTDEMRPR